MMLGMLRKVSSGRSQPVIRAPLERHYRRSRAGGLSRVARRQTAPRHGADAAVVYPSRASSGADFTVTTAWRTGLGGWNEEVPGVLAEDRRERHLVQADRAGAPQERAVPQ